MGYQTVFDVSENGFQWWIPFLMFIFGSLVVVIGWGIRTSGDADSSTRSLLFQHSSTKGLLFQGGGAIGILAAFVLFILMYGEYRAASRALATHNYSVIEGTVCNFIPMPVGGHSTESFDVDGVSFEYVDSEWNKGFIHNGVQARITYTGKKRIIRVETR